MCHTERENTKNGGKHYGIHNDGTAANDVLIFRFYDGSEVTRKWKDRSRSQSWTDEMKAAARQKALERRNQNA